MKPIQTLVMLFLSLLALVQLVRVLLGWSVVVNGIDIPAWVSAIAVLVAGALALLLWRESRR